MPEQTKNRSRQEIIKDILSSLEKSNLSKTKVMYRASLSYTQLKYYEDYLRNTALIGITVDELWTITEKGNQYLQACKLADSILMTPDITAPVMPAASSATSFQ